MMVSRKVQEFFFYGNTIKKVIALKYVHNVLLYKRWSAVKFWNTVNRPNAFAIVWASQLSSWNVKSKMPSFDIRK